MSGYEFSLARASAPGEIAETVRRYGIAHLPGYLDGPTTREVTDACTALLGVPGPWVTRLEYSLGRSVRVETHELAKHPDYVALSDAYASSALRDVADDFMDEPYVFNYDLYIAHDVEGSHHFAHDLHYDRNPHLKFFLYLTDVTADTGPMYCIPGSHDLAKRAQAENRERRAIPAEKDTRVIPDDYRSRWGVPVEGPAGTLLVFDSDLLHSATHIVAGQRLAARNRCLRLRDYENEAAVRGRSPVPPVPVRGGESEVARGR